MSKFNGMKPITYEQLIKWLTMVCDDKKKLNQNVVMRESKGDFKQIRFVCKADADLAHGNVDVNEGDIFIS